MLSHTHPYRAIVHRLNFAAADYDGDEEEKDWSQSECLLVINVLWTDLEWLAAVVVVAAVIVAAIVHRIH